jgi:hypothetical protein
MKPRFIKQTTFALLIVAVTTHAGFAASNLL